VLSLAAEMKKSGSTHVGEWFGQLSSTFLVNLDSVPFLSTSGLHGNVISTTSPSSSCFTLALQAF
jgi:hypothetical protein